MNASLKLLLCEVRVLDLNLLDVAGGGVRVREGGMSSRVRCVRPGSWVIHGAWLRDLNIHFYSVSKFSESRSSRQIFS